MMNNLFSVQKTLTHNIYNCMGIKFSVSNSQNVQEQLDNASQHYDEIIARLRGKDKIRVCFYVFEISKWKTDTLYRLLKDDDRFEPFIVLGMVPLRIKKYSKEFKRKKLQNQLEYFKAKGYDVQSGFDIAKNRNIPLSQYKPDVVFYQQQLGNCPENDIEEVMQYALTYYVPYNVPNYGFVDHDYNFFCARLFRFYCLSESLKEYYEQQIPYAKNIKAVGHTALDLFYLNKNEPTTEKYIIYAPHFSIMHPKNMNKFYYATIGQNGRMILEYAKKHPEYTWVFKPHPNLREALTNIEVPQNIIDEYYNEWREIGIVCENADYYDYFINSKVMLTDCGSFLTEYFCTGKPLIHMLNTASVNWPCKVMRPMFESFYETCNNNELLETLNQVIENNNDYKKEQRDNVRQKLNFANQYAAQNIMNDLISTLFK